MCEEFGILENSWIQVTRTSIDPSEQIILQNYTQLALQTLRESKKSLQGTYVLLFSSSRTFNHPDQINSEGTFEGTYSSFVRTSFLLFLKKRSEIKGGAGDVLNSEMIDLPSCRSSLQG